MFKIIILHNLRCNRCCFMRKPAYRCRYRHSQVGHEELYVFGERISISTMQNISSLFQYAAPVIGLSVLYTAGLYTYRLYFHPLRKFPGPKLAACTNWYEFYYDVIQQGQFTAHLQDLHKQYGTALLSDEHCTFDAMQQKGNS
jgi:hypothetical protein